MRKVGVPTVMVLSVTRWSVCPAERRVHSYRKMLPPPASVELLASRSKSSPKLMEEGRLAMAVGARMSLTMKLVTTGVDWLPEVSVTTSSI